MCVCPGVTRLWCHRSLRMALQFTPGKSGSDQTVHQPFLDTDELDPRAQQFAELSGVSFKSNKTIAPS